MNENERTTKVALLAMYRMLKKQGEAIEDLQESIALLVEIQTELLEKQNGK